MGWKGALEGAVLGNIIGGTAGAFFGSILGNKLEDPEQHNPSVKRSFYLFFQCLGKLTGKNSATQAYAKNLLQAWNFGDDLTAELLAQFEAGKNTVYSLEWLVKAFKAAAESWGMAGLKEGATVLFCILLPLDRPESREWDMISQAVRTLGTSSVYNDFVAEFRLYDRASTGLTEKESYDRLWLSSDCSDRDIKQMWRKESLRFYPFKDVSGIGFSSEFASSAKRIYRRRFQAYKTLIQVRRIR